MYIIYKHTNLTSGKSYVGLTKRSMRTRWLQHTSEARQNINSRCFMLAIRKYGENDWAHEILESGIPTVEQACEKEIYYVNLYDTFFNGYNVTKGGQGALGVVGSAHPLHGVPKNKDSYAKSRVNSAITIANRSIERQLEVSLNLSEGGKNREQIVMFHLKKGLIQGIQSELAALIGCKTSHLGSVINGNYNYIKGWFVWEGPDKDYTTEPAYTFVHPEYGEETLSLKAMCKKYNLSKGNLSSVATGRRNHTKQWRNKMLEERDKPQAS